MAINLDLFVTSSTDARALLGFRHFPSHTKKGTVEDSLLHAQG